MDKYKFIIKLVLGIIVTIFLNSVLVITIVLEALTPQSFINDQAAVGVIISGIVTADGALLGYLFAKKIHTNDKKEDPKKEEPVIDDKEKKE